MYLEQALQISLRVYGRDHPHVAMVQNNLGVLMGKLELHQHAERYFWQALRSYIVTLGQRHPSTNMVRRNLYPYVLRAMDKVAARLNLHPPTMAERQLTLAQPWLLRIAHRDEGPAMRSINPASHAQHDEPARAS